MRKMSEVGYTFRRLYEQLVQLPVSRRKSVTPQVQSRVSKYPKRWKLWTGCLLGLLATATCHADRAIIVLAPNMPPGVVLPGGDFQSSGTLPPTICSFACTDTMSSTLLGFSSTDRVETITVGSAINGLTYGVQIPGQASTYGIWIVASDVYLVPVGGWWTYTGKWGPSTINQSGSFTSTRAELCETSDPTTAYPVAGYACYVKSRTVFQKTTSGTEQATISLSLRAVAGAAAQAGETKITKFYGGTYNAEKTFNYDKPTSIIVAGLTCTLDAGSGQYTFKDGVAPSSTIGKTVGAFTGADLGITASCAGTNTTSPPITVPVSYVLTPSGGAVANGGKLTHPTQPSFYMTFTRDGSSTCNASASNVIPPDGTTAAKIDDVKPGATITKKPVLLGATLCTTGDTTQAPGNYQMAVTASIVSY